MEEQEKTTVVGNIGGSSRIATTPQGVRPAPARGEIVATIPSKSSVVTKNK